MDIKKQLVAVNLECDKKNKFFNIEGMTEQQITTISDRFKDKTKWMIIRR
jgi:hypothetical protein